MPVNTTLSRIIPRFTNCACNQIPDFQRTYAFDKNEYPSHDLQQLLNDASIAKLSCSVIITGIKTEHSVLAVFKKY
jgi:hypothetical protein